MRLDCSIWGDSIEPLSPRNAIVQSFKTFLLCLQEELKVATMRGAEYEANSPTLYSQSIKGQKRKIWETGCLFGGSIKL